MKAAAEQHLRSIKADALNGHLNRTDLMYLSRAIGLFMRQPRRRQPTIMLLPGQKAEEVMYGKRYKAIGSA